MNFKEIIIKHKKKYPLMQPQDFGKLAYQSEFGPKHLGIVYEQALSYVLKEWESEDILYDAWEAEYIGNGYYRLHFWKDAMQYEKELFTKLFVLSAQKAGGSLDGLKGHLNHVVECFVSDRVSSALNGDLKEEEIQFFDFKSWLKEYEDAGYPVVSHSDIFRESYHPHYRLIQKCYIDWLPVLLKTAKLLQGDKNIIISIDGNSGSGKTTCAAVLQEVFGGNVFHMDDYYLPIKERSENWREAPAGNMDLKRFREEILEPLKKGGNVNYKPFLCQKQAYGDTAVVEPTKLTIVEGSYSQHPELSSYYDLKVFLSCDEETQKRRLMEREGDYYPVFESTWIPMEKLYHEACRVKEKADFML